MAQNIKGQQTNTGKTHFKDGHIPWNKGTRKKYFCSDCDKQVTYKGFKCHSCAAKGRRHTDKSKKLISLHNKAPKGAQHHSWRGGITPFEHAERIKFRRTIQKQVLDRDNYTCQICGQRGGNLQVDHIQPWKDYVELRFSMDNCRTLCMDCHYIITVGKPKPKNIIWGHNFKKVRVVT